jgi:endonuclease YncB( thermonuclease family)
MNTMLNRIVVFLMICFTATFAFAGTQHKSEVIGYVVYVTRDCLLVVSIDHEGEVVRLAGITYPEDQTQAQGDLREFIRARVENKNVRIERLGQDRRGNTLGRIYHDGQSLNDSLIQIGLVQPARPDNSGPALASLGQ